MFENELNKTLTYLCLIDRLLIEINNQLLVVNSTSKEYELQRAVFYDFINKFSLVIKYLIIDCVHYCLINELNWDLVDSKHRELETYIKDFVWTEKESSLDILLMNLVNAVNLVDLLYDFRNQMALVEDNMIQVREHLAYLISLLINSKYCSNQLKLYVIGLNLDPRIIFDPNIFKNYCFGKN
nr:hypothetical protein [Navicula tsukamotoi]UXN44526.1 hypothetical protein [Navicula tsukamotoi]